MIVWQTTYVFYDDLLEETEIIAEMKRSFGNARCVAHRVNTTGDIISTKIFDHNTQTLKVTPLTPQMEAFSYKQRKWLAKKKPFMLDQGLSVDERDVICNCLETTFFHKQQLSKEEKSAISLVRKKTTHKTKLDQELRKAGLE